MEVPTLVGSRFTLRPFSMDDVSSLTRHMNDDRVARKVTHIPFPYTEDHAKAWLQKTERWVREDATRVDLAIVVDGEVIGSVAFINLDGHKAQVSYWLTPSEWGKGIIPEALRMLVDFGFTVLQLERIYAYVYTENKASARVLTKCGFQFEGTHQKEWRKEIDGLARLFDSNYYAIVKPSKIKAVAIKLGYESLKPQADVIARKLRDAGCVVDIEDATGVYDLAVALGGDGTVMRTVTEFSSRGIPTIGINGGHLGFLTVGDISDSDAIIARVLQNQFTIERRLALELRHRGEVIGPIANDIVARHATSVGTFTVAVDGVPLFSNLEADGIIVATPTGSTAYSLSIGGPVVFPTSRDVLVSCMAPMRVSTRPFLLPQLGAGGELAIKLVDSKQRQPVALNADSHKLMLAIGETVTIRASRTPLLFATFGQDSYLEALKKKFGLVQ